MLSSTKGGMGGSSNSSMTSVAPTTDWRKRAFSMWRRSSSASFSASSARVASSGAASAAGSGSASSSSEGAASSAAGVASFHRPMPQQVLPRGRPHLVATVFRLPRRLLLQQEILGDSRPRRRFLCSRAGLQVVAWWTGRWATGGPLGGPEGTARGP